MLGHAFVFETSNHHCFEMRRIPDPSGHFAIDLLGISEACINWLDEQVGEADYKLFDHTSLTALVFRRMDDAFGFKLRWA